MEQNDDLRRLADVVEELLANFNRVKAENGELSHTLQGRESRIAELEEEIARLQGEKQDVSKKVSGILNTIQEWEKGLGCDEKKNGGENDPQRRPEPVPQLFSMDA